MEHLQESASDDQLVTGLEDLAEQPRKNATEKKSKKDSESQEEEQPKQTLKQQEEQEVEELIGRINALEASGQQDDALVDALAQRGLSAKALKQAWQQHIIDFPEHGHDEQAMQEALQEQHEENLEERLAGVRSRKQEETNPLYDVQNKLDEGMYISQDDLYNALEQARTYISERGGLTDNEYEALNTIQQKSQQVGYSRNETVESIKKMGRLQIGESYIGQNNQRL